MEKPRQVPYSTNQIRFKHYGKIIENLIDKAVEFKEGQEKEVLIRLIANHMKKSYLTWNREAVTDEVIFQDLKELSGGKLVADKALKLSETRDILAKNKKKDHRKRSKS
jgi:hypothetical protein